MAPEPTKPVAKLEHEKVTVIFPRKKAAAFADGRVSDSEPVIITKEFIEAYFNMPMVQACAELGVCCTAMKKACRKLGLERWPYRNTVSAHKRVTKRKQGQTQPAQVGQPEMKNVSSLYSSSQTNDNQHASRAALQPTFCAGTHAAFTSDPCHSWLQGPMNPNSSFQEYQGRPSSHPPNFSANQLQCSTSSRIGTHQLQYCQQSQQSQLEQIHQQLASHQAQFLQQQPVGLTTNLPFNQMGNQVPLLNQCGSNLQQRLTGSEVEAVGL